MNNVNTGNISIDDICKLKGLKDAWKYIIDNICEDLTIEFIKKIHFEIRKCQDIKSLGEFREKDVEITGTSWRPKLPNECDYEYELNNILSNPNKLDMCLDLFCWIQRSQMFLDGNKRVANLVANKEMIKNGQGIISIPVELTKEYVIRLINYYESGDNSELKLWLYNNCIEGLEV